MNNVISFQMRASITCALGLFTFFFYVKLLASPGKRSVLLFRKLWSWEMENFIIKFALVRISCSVSRRPPSCSYRAKLSSHHHHIIIGFFTEWQVDKFKCFLLLSSMVNCWISQVFLFEIFRQETTNKNCSTCSEFKVIF